MLFSLPFDRLPLARWLADGYPFVGDLSPGIMVRRCAGKN